MRRNSCLQRCWMYLVFLGLLPNVFLDRCCCWLLLMAKLFLFAKYLDLMRCLVILVKFLFDL